MPKWRRDLRTMFYMTVSIRIETVLSKIVEFPCFSSCLTIGLSNSFKKD